MTLRWRWSRSRVAAGVALAAALTAGAAVQSVSAQSALGARQTKGQSIKEFLSSGGLMAVEGRKIAKNVPDGFDPTVPGPDVPVLDSDNEYVNDPCLDARHTEPFPISFFDVVQSETDVAVWNGGPSAGRWLVAGYNDSEGFTTNTRGLSGFSFSTNAGQSWVDGGGLPIRFPDPGPPPPGDLINDQLFGDPVIAVDQQRGIFYFSSIYLSARGYFTVGVSRGEFKGGGPQGSESVPTIRCIGQAGLHGVPLPPGPAQNRPTWKKPVEAVRPPFLGPDNSDFLDKEWIYVDQKTGNVYLTYTNFQADGSTPLQMVVSYDQGETWTAPRTIVPDIVGTFNQATQPVTTPDGRLIVSWWSRTFDSDVNLPLSSRIEAAFSDDDGLTWSTVRTIKSVDPQGEPLGFNRARALIINAPIAAVDKGVDDGIDTAAERRRPGFGNVYVIFHDGVSDESETPFVKAADIRVARSRNGGATWDRPVRVNDDATETVHIFPTIEVDKHGKVYASWIDRRRDPSRNILNDTWAATSTDRGASFGLNERVSDVNATSWFARADAAPNFGDYNGSAMLNDETFVTVWADGRFEPPGQATFLRRHTFGNPNVLFEEAPPGL